ncbi:MAG TPA: FUSC family protein [Rhodopila sp.]|uniref:FUSC family protein n=1 Tax=Rhodopila sp. TaxID=2480087 RepID=UPI002BCCE73C|nr:FUSC family protein [Rhodopila sp.]HVY14865.1 FUSC family protein [Rhodopila sp.]
MIAWSRRALDRAAALVQALYLDLLDVRWSGHRAALCAVATLSTTLATVLALLLHLEDVWWASISGFICTQATSPASVRKAILRIIGTAAGAGAIIALSPLLVDDPVLITLALFVASTLGLLGLLVSDHGYAWMLGAVTVDMVLIGSMTDPDSVLHVGVLRTAEVAVGSLAAVLVAWLAGMEDTSHAEAPPRPGWRHLLDAQWPAMGHATRAALGIVAVPWVWQWLHVPSQAQIAVTIAAVMALPAVGADPQEDQRKLRERGIYRLVGCFLGGIVGLLCLAISIQSFLPWLLTLGAGIWISAHIQASERGTGYIGTQAAVVFIMTLVQGSGPPESLVPGVSRFAGIAGGLLVLLLVSLLTAPDPAQPAVARR